ncbi:MAG: flagellar basal-body rod protein FlgF [Oligoflexia bacterium]|nr:flagellar basal-body rod protein FlgF [Oligoflexia bacterium]
MSSKGIYTALSGALAQSHKLDTTAQNIANANTPGFKSDKNTFKEHLTILEKAPDVITVPRVPASIESFFDMQGTDKSYVDVDRTFVDFSQGGLKATGNSLDVALEGKGFIEVLTPQGTRLTRKGIMTLNSKGELVTTEGLHVLQKGEGPAEERKIKLNGSENITFNQKGDIFQDAQNVATLSIVEFDNNDHLKKIGHALYAITDDRIKPLANANTQIHQGFIETSNVNIVQEMTDLIQTTRNFESAQRAIKAYDEMDGKLINDVPKF